VARRSGAGQNDRDHRGPGLPLGPPDPGLGLLDERAEELVDQRAGHPELLGQQPVPREHTAFLLSVRDGPAARDPVPDRTLGGVQSRGEQQDDGPVHALDLATHPGEGVRLGTVRGHPAIQPGSAQASCAAPVRGQPDVAGGLPPPMELVLASNFDDRLVERVADLPVRTFFGGFPVSLTGAGRPPFILPDIDRERFRRHLATIHRAGREFYATLNSNDLGLKEYGSGYVATFLREVGELLDLGVDGFVIALPSLLEAVHRAYPEVPLSVSSFARIRTVSQAEYFLHLGADTVILEEANRDFRLLRGLVRAGARVEILANQTCIRDCPFRAHHLNTSSLCSQPGGDRLWFEFPILECGLELVRDPRKLISSIWVRPEDLSVYEEAGVHRFKVSGRNRTTDWLVHAARAYADRRYDGNLLDILSFVQIKAPSNALEELSRRGVSPGEVGPLRAAFAAFDDVTIRNDAFPPEFLRRIAAMDCEHRSCEECGYCGEVAEKVVRIGGKPPSAYRPPTDLPSGVGLLEAFGTARGASGSDQVAVRNLA
jgi:collagenase-like PrtC family protease